MKKPLHSGRFFLLGLPKGKKHEVFNVVKSEENLFSKSIKNRFLILLDF